MIILRTKTLDQEKEILALESPHIVVRSDISSFRPNILGLFLIVTLHTSVDVQRIWSYVVTLQKVSDDDYVFEISEQHCSLNEQDKRSVCQS